MQIGAEAEQGYERDRTEYQRRDRPLSQFALRRSGRSPCLRLRRGPLRRLAGRSPAALLVTGPPCAVLPLLRRPAIALS